MKNPLKENRNKCFISITIKNWQLRPKHLGKGDKPPKDLNYDYDRLKLYCDLCQDSLKRRTRFSGTLILN